MAGRFSDKDNRSPAMLASLTLHAMLFGSAFLALPFLTSPVKEVQSVPITIVTHAPLELSEAEEAPKAEQAAAPDISPTVVAPEAAPPPPTPAPPSPQPKPTPTPPKPAPPKPAPAPTPTPKPAVKPLDLAALASSLPQTKAAKAPAKPQAKPLDLGALAASLPRHPSAPTRGAARPAVDLSKIAGPPRPLSGDDLSALIGKLNRLWSPNCVSDTAAGVNVRVSFHLSPDGHLVGSPQILDRAVLATEGPVVAASAQRALTAVQRGEPYSELPRDRYDTWKDIIVRFNAKQACAGV